MLHEWRIGLLIPSVSKPTTPQETRRRKSATRRLLSRPATGHSPRFHQITYRHVLPTDLRSMTSEQAFAYLHQVRSSTQVDCSVMSLHESVNKAFKCQKVKLEDTKSRASPEDNSSVVRAEPGRQYRLDREFRRLPLLAGRSESIRVKSGGKLTAVEQRQQQNYDAKLQQLADARAQQMSTARSLLGLSESRSRLSSDGSSNTTQEADRPTIVIPSPSRAASVITARLDDMAETSAQREKLSAR